MNDQVEKFNLQLICIVEKYEYLYNKNCRDYKDKVKKINTWNTIARKLKSTSEFCQSQWSSLRERFTRERRNLKAQAPSGSAGGVPKPPSAYYKAMLYLEPHIRNRRGTIGNIPGSSSTQCEKVSSGDESNEEMDVETLDIDEDDDVLVYLHAMEKDKTQMSKNQQKNGNAEIQEIKKENKKQTNKNLNENKENNTDANIEKRTAFTPNRKRKEENQHSGILSSSSDKKMKTENPDDATLQIVTNTLQKVGEWCESSEKTPDKTEDVEWNFCMTTYSQLRKLSKPKRRIARTDISNIMFELESDSD